MKFKLYIILGFILSLFFQEVRADICTSNGNGNWNSAATWDCGSVPGNGDTAIVAATHVVTVNCNCGTYNNMRIEVYGTLDFPNGRKIDLDANSVVQVYAGGSLTGGNGGSKIIIDGVDKWDGDDGDISGPSFVDDSETGFTSGVLPVELTEFYGYQLGEKIVLNWITASEINNDYFIVEKLFYGKEFENIGKVKGAGNSNRAIKYEFVDHAPLSVNYYQLHQFDYDGKSAVSKIIIVPYKIESKERRIAVYPNPKTEEEKANIKFIGFKGQEVIIVVQDVLGRQYYSKVIISIDVDNFIYVIDPHNSLKIGTYIIIGSSDNRLYKKKLLVK